MRPVLLDSSLYITALRTGEETLCTLRWLSPQAPLWLSAVVLEGLHAGVSRRDRHMVERLDRDFVRLGRVLVPTLSDWAQAGKALAQLAIEYGYEQIGQGRLTNDALIAMSAARSGILIVTANERDFSRPARLRPFQYEARRI